MEKSLTVDEITYPSLAAACRAYGVKFGVYQARRRTGWNVEEALGITPRRAGPRRGTKIFKIAGETYLSFPAACQAHGLNPSRVHSRLSMGWTLEEAFDLAPRQPPPRVSAEMRRGETGIIIIQGQPFVWKDKDQLARD